MEEERPSLTRHKTWKIKEKIGPPQNVKLLYKKHHHTQRQKSDDGLKANI